MEHNKHVRWWAIGAVVVFAAVLRLHNLDFESLFMDEIHQVSYYPNSVVQLISDAARQQQPPLDYWIGHLVSKVSYGDFAVRLPAALFGTVSVFLLILIIERLTSLPMALFAGLVVGLLPYHIYFSQHARPYSIAIFFFLAVLFVLRRLLTEMRVTFVLWAVFFLITVCFLYTRALAPLVIIITIAAISLTLVTFSYASMWPRLQLLRSRLMAIAGICAAAVFAYLPVLTGILETGSRYTQRPASLDVAVLLLGWQKFDPRPLLEAYVTQLEPIGHLIAPLVILSLVLAIRSHFASQHIEFVYFAGLLVIASLLHLFVFQSKTDFAFRPPYAIYMFPLAIILAAVGASALINRAQAGKCFYLKVITSLLGVALVAYTTYYTVDFKTTRKVSDWRGLTQYLLSLDQNKHLLVFDGLNRFGIWEPVFYGVPRYTDKRLRGTTVAAIPDHVDKITSSALRPVFVLFHYRDYYLTSRSRYSFHPRPSSDQAINFSRLEQDPMLSIRTFLGFHVVEPRIGSGRLADDILYVVNRLIADLPATSASVELHIAAAYLKDSLGIPHVDRHVARALALTPSGKRDKVSMRLGALHTPEP